MSLEIGKLQAILLLPTRILQSSENNPTQQKNPLLNVLRKYRYSLWTGIPPSTSAYGLKQGKQEWVLLRELLHAFLLVPVDRVVTWV